MTSNRLATPAHHSSPSMTAPLASGLNFQGQLRQLAGTRPPTSPATDWFRPRTESTCAFHWVVPVWLAAARTWESPSRSPPMRACPGLLDLAVVGPKRSPMRQRTATLWHVPLRRWPLPSPTDYPSESRISSPKSATSATTSLRPIGSGHRSTAQPPGNADLDIAGFIGHCDLPVT